MKKEEIDFLRDLQNELNTQEHDEQAAPRYWGIAERIEVPCPDNCGDPYIYVGDGVAWTCKEYVEYIESNELYVGHEEEWAETNKSDMDELVSFGKYTLKDSEVRIVWKETLYHRIGEDSNVFLTKKACKRHIEQNYYHYSNPHTYAMTAWRNPEFEHLLKIIQTMDLDKIQEDE